MSKTKVKHTGLPEGTKPKALEGDGERKDYAPVGMSEDEKRRLLRQDTRSEFFRISQSLEDFHGLFSQLWDMGFPTLTWDIPTAAVRFNRDCTKVEFLFNPLMWRDLDLYTKSFVVGHECLHAMLNHGLRSKDCPLPRLANIALDIVVNHMLVTKFGFCRAALDLSPILDKTEQKDEQGNVIPPPQHLNSRGEDMILCWIDTVFGERQGEIKRNKPFEYYYAILEENIVICPNGTGKLLLRGRNGGFGQSGGQTLDDHEFLEDFDDEDVKDNLSDKLNERMTEDEKEDFADKVMKSEEGKAADRAAKEAEKGKDKSDDQGGKQAGSLAGRLTYQPPNQRWAKKKRWETVIHRWARRYYMEETTADQWARKSRRMVSFGTDMMLPHDADNDDKDLQRIDVMFFLDVSGSCFHLKDRFIKAAMSLPADRFNVRLFCFDTEIHPIDLKNPKITGGGGTAFDILEDEVQKQLKSGELARYPDGVFVITDGMGNKIYPEKEDRWYWFLSENYRDCIPEACHKFMLDQFE